MKIRYITHMNPVSFMMIMITVICVIGALFYGREFPEGSVLNNIWVFVWLLFTSGFGFSSYVFYKELYKSPVITYPGGWDTLASPIPIAEYVFPEHNGKPTFRYPFKIFPNGSFDIGIWKWPGGGKHGWTVVLDSPGMIETRGVFGIHLNCKEKIRYLPSDVVDYDTHDDLGAFYDAIASYLERKGFNFSRDAPLDIVLIADKRLHDKLKIPNGSFSNLLNFKNTQAMWNQERKDLKKRIKELEKKKTWDVAIMRSMRGETPEPEKRRDGEDDGR